MNKERWELLREEDATFQNKIRLLKAVPESLSVWMMSGSTAYVHDLETVEQYHEKAKDLVDWELHAYQVRSHGKDKFKVCITHTKQAQLRRLAIELDVWCGDFEETQDFIHMLSDGKCKLKVTTQVQEARAHTVVSTSCIDNG